METGDQGVRVTQREFHSALTLVWTFIVSGRRVVGAVVLAAVAPTAGFGAFVAGRILR